MGDGIGVIDAPRKDRSAGHGARRRIRATLNPGGEPMWRMVASQPGRDPGLAGLGRRLRRSAQLQPERRYRLRVASAREACRRCGEGCQIPRAVHGRLRRNDPHEHRSGVRKAGDRSACSIAKRPRFQRSLDGVNRLRVAVKRSARARRRGSREAQRGDQAGSGGQGLEEQDLLRHAHGAVDAGNQDASEEEDADLRRARDQ